MNRSVTKEIRSNTMRELPCVSCLKYMSQDIKNSKIYRDKAKILTYLNDISDPDVIRNLTNLLKSLSQL